MFEIMPIERRSYHMRPFDPFREMQEMQRAFWGNSQSLASFRTDISETGESYKLEAELPGFKKEDITVDIEDDTLTIKAEHAENTDEKNDEGEYVRRERYYGSYQRSFNVSEIDVEGISAAYENGVLTLNLPKKAPVKPESRRLEIQ